MSKIITRDSFRRPETILKDLLRRDARGLLQSAAENPQIFFRALVIAVDVEGGLLENPSAQGSLSHNFNGNKFDVAARYGPKNPPNSVKARILSDGLDKFASDENLRVFWPFFPDNSSDPIKPGEHVYVMFEDRSQNHGLWLTKVSGHDGVNYAPGQSFYKEQQNRPLSNSFDDLKGLSGANDKKFNKNDDAAETKPGNRLTGLFGD